MQISEINPMVWIIVAVIIVLIWAYHTGKLTGVVNTFKTHLVPVVDAHVALVTAAAAVAPAQPAATAPALVADTAKVSSFAAYLRGVK